MDAPETDYQGFHHPKGVFYTAEKKNQIYYIRGFTICLFALEFFLHNIILDFSTFLQLNLDPNGTYCWIWNPLAYFENYEGILLLAAFVANCYNLFSSISWIFLSTFGIFCNGVLKLVYLDPRPFWVDERLFPCICTANYGNPSTTGLNSFLMFINIYKIYSIRKHQVSPLQRWTVLSICCLGIFCMSLSRFMGNVHSLNQIFFGYGIAYIIIYCYYDILEIDYFKQDVFRNIMRYNRFLMIATALLGLNFFVNIIHTFVNFENPDEWLDMITKHCKYIPFNFFDNESYQKSSVMIISYTAIICLYIELRFVHKNNLKQFYLFNQNKQRRWNNTPWWKTLIRIAISTTFCIVYLRNFFGSTSQNLAVFLLVGTIIPMIVMGTWIYLGNKFFCQLLGLNNNYIEEEVRKISPISFLSVEPEDTVRLKPQESGRKGSKDDASKMSFNEEIEKLKSGYFKEDEQ